MRRRRGRVEDPFASSRHARLVLSAIPRAIRRDPGAFSHTFTPAAPGDTGLLAHTAS